MQQIVNEWLERWYVQFTTETFEDDKFHLHKIAVKWWNSCP
jgi:hypothetical protein